MRGQDLPQGDTKESAIPSKDSSPDGTKKWTYETLKRYGRNLFIIIYDDETRGSIALEDDEVAKWKKVIESLNSQN